MADKELTQEELEKIQGGKRTAMSDGSGRPVVKRRMMSGGVSDPASGGTVDSLDTEGGPKGGLADGGLTGV